ncbi:radical SAM protein [Candidatus Woesearchaeota archaeon]|nr:radical SAM protein [Candidatus Woesearchaeota archaeon]
MTRSVCPKCLKEIKANVDEKDGSVYLTKKCNKHGSFSAKIFHDAKIYHEYMRFYNILKVDKNLNDHYALPLTNACNLKCPICFVDTHNKKEKVVSIKDIKKFIDDNPRVGKINLFGGEPTTRKDLPKIVKYIASRGIKPVLVTNGIKIGEPGYLEGLKGLDSVFLQFDGFNDKTDRMFRGKSLTAIRMRALDRLQVLGIPTLLEVTCAKGINDSGFADILDLVVDYPNIKAISFRSYCYLGKKEFPADVCMTPDELIGVLEKETDQKISLRKVIDFEKMFMVASDWFKIMNCSYMHFYMITREKDGWKPINSLVPVHRVRNQLNRYLKLRKKGRITSGLYFTANILPWLISSKNIGFLFREFFRNLECLIDGKNYSLADNRNVIITFEGACDINTYDFEVAEKCRGYYVHTDDLSFSTTAESNLKREKSIHQEQT